jgi:hypothetical protein
MQIGEHMLARTTRGECGDGLELSWCIHHVGLMVWNG